MKIVGGICALIYIFFSLFCVVSEAALPATAVGVLSNKAMWDRARARVNSKQEPFYSLYRSTLDRANLASTPNPFVSVGMTRNVSDGGIIFGWVNGGANSLDEAGERLTEAGWRLQSYAIAYLFTNDTRYADKLIQYMRPWAEKHTPVNMYDFNIDFANSRFDGSGGDDWQNGRPWNFALDSMWQTYGLISASDAYLLLKRSGYNISASDDTLYRNWLKKVVSATNAGFNSWTKWADTHRNSGAYKRHRADNHLSWAMTGLIAAGVALEDWDLVDYVINGGEWKDIKAPAYSNPSSYKQMILWSMDRNGTIYEEQIKREGMIGYCYFHIQALMDIAMIGQLATGEDLFNYVSPNGTNLNLAYKKYVDYALGKKISPDEKEKGINFTQTYSWIYEAAYSHWPNDVSFYTAASMNSRKNFILQGLGPYALFWADDLPSEPPTGSTTSKASTTSASTTSKTSDSSSDTPSSGSTGEDAKSPGINESPFLPLALLTFIVYVLFM